MPLHCAEAGTAAINIAAARLAAILLQWVRIVIILPVAIS
jgi:hypothetical protein